MKTNSIILPIIALILAAVTGYYIGASGRARNTPVTEKPKQKMPDTPEVVNNIDFNKIKNINNPNIYLEQKHQILKQIAKNIHSINMSKYDNETFESQLVDAEYSDNEFKIETWYQTLKLKLRYLDEDSRLTPQERLTFKRLALSRANDPIVIPKPSEVKVSMD